MLARVGAVSFAPRAGTCARPRMTKQSKSGTRTRCVRMRSAVQRGLHSPPSARRAASSSATPLAGRSPQDAQGPQELRVLCQLQSTGTAVAPPLARACLPPEAEAEVRLSPRACATCTVEPHRERIVRPECAHMGRQGDLSTSRACDRLLVPRSPLGHGGSGAALSVPSALATRRAARRRASA